MFDFGSVSGGGSKFSLSGFNFGDFGVSSWFGQLVDNPVLLVAVLIGLYCLGRLVFIK